MVQGRELKLHSGWCLRNTKGGRVVQGRELNFPLGWFLKIRELVMVNPRGCNILLVGASKLNVIFT